jgi:ubiquinone/menaquinone biosynthesis C-methylase UbiE
VVSVDLNQGAVIRGRSVQKNHMPWLEFQVGNMKDLPVDLPSFDRITGNLSFMFFRPDRFTALKQLVSSLSPGGQVVLTFPSLGTFDSLWERIKREMADRNLTEEAKALDEYIFERPSADHARQWLNELGMEKVEVTEWPLEIERVQGQTFFFIHY